MTTTTLQHNLILQADDENIALSNYLTHPYQKHEIWIQSKQNHKQRTSNNRQRIPNNSHLRNQVQHNLEKRKSALASTTIEPRRPSTTSSISSLQSEVSTSSKVSFSNRLRKVFSMSNIKSTKDISSLQERNGSIVSISSSLSSVESSKKPSLKRRSIASLTSLFQKTSIKEEPTETKPKKPALRVDTSSRQRNGRNITPDSPNSVISSRSSISRLPPPVSNPRFIHPDLPSPTPSSSSSSSSRPDEIFRKPNRVYGIGLHASPKLRPAASSSSSSLVCNEKRRIKFCPTVQVHETFSANDYDRRCDPNATCQKVTPMLVMKIKQELNEYKLTEMEVHVESRQYTQFYL